MSDQVKAFLIEVYNYLEGHGHIKAAIEVGDFVHEQGAES